MINRCNLPRDPALTFHLPLSNYDGNAFMSKDACGHLCTAIGTTWRTDGRYFNGINDYINLNNTFSTVSSSNSKTIIVMATPSKTDSSTESRLLALLRTAISTSFAFLTLGNPATWRAGYVTSGTTLIRLDSGVPLIVGQPTFLALVQDNINIRFQVDNTIILASNGGIPIMDNPVKAYIGAFNNNGTPALFFQGIISEAFIFSRALSSIEVERIRLGIKR